MKDTLSKEETCIYKKVAYADNGLISYESLQKNIINFYIVQLL